MYQSRWDAGRIEGFGHMGGMGDRRAEHDCGAVGGLFLPMADHLLGDRRAVHDFGNFVHVKI